MIMNLTDEELLDYSEEHLFYEVEMLLNVSALSTENLPQIIRNIRVESFAIHLRNLIIFFYPTSTVFPTDVYASHFFSDTNEWRRICPPLSQTLRDAKKRADKEVGHLTMERIAGTNDPRKEWDIRGLVNEITPIIKLFCASADNNRLHHRTSTLF